MKSIFLKAAVTAVLMGMTAVAFGAPGGGKGGGGGGGGGGGKPSTDLFAEMVIVDRDINGAPITTLGLGPKDTWIQVPQPIMFGDKDGCPLSFTDLAPVGPTSVYADPMVGIDARHIPFVDGEIPENYKLCMTEADLGRLSVVRAPDDVLDRALAEMVTSLSTSQDPIGTDEAGRLTVTYTEADATLTTKAIDAPAENLAAFQRILEQAKLYHTDVSGGAPIDLPVWPAGESGARHLLNRVAPMLAAASDKFGHVGLDELIYVTQILDLAGDMTNEAKGVFGQPWAGGIFNFEGFEYNRSSTYSGNVCYLKVITPEAGAGFGNLPVDVTAQVVKEPIMSLVFGDEGFTGTNAWGFKQAVDDARAVIFWAHEHPVPADLIDYCKLEHGDVVTRGR